MVNEQIGWGSFIPQPDQEVEAIGTVKENRDLQGITFWTLEAEEMHSAS